MTASDFQNRWAKKRTQDAEAAPATAPEAPVEPAANVAPKAPQPLPTLEDVAKLSADSDYSAFVAKGVDENVKRSAMKKLFTDPHFNIMDRLDIYIDDYTKPDPIPPEMLALLEHAKSVLNPLKHLESPAMRMISRDDVPPADLDEVTSGEDAALEENGESLADETALSQETDEAVDADADKSANDAVPDASSAQVSERAGADESEQGTPAVGNAQADFAGHHNHHTGAQVRPDAKS